jgi:hypothetical protein
MARTTTTRVKNISGKTIPAGSVVYFSGFDSRDKVPTIDLASCDNENKMPAAGILLEKATSDQDNIVSIKITGVSSGHNTAGVSINSDVYVGLNGQISFIDPTPARARCRSNCLAEASAST